jgi:transposase
MAEQAHQRVLGGVDTHKDLHVAAVINGLGQLVGVASFPTTTRGYRQLLAWMRSHGALEVVGVEGTGSWGAGLARYLIASAVDVIEVNRPNRQRRRRNGKSDPADAEAAARAVLSGEATATPKSANGTIECIRMLRIARRSAIQSRTQAINQMRSIIDTAPDDLRAELAALSHKKLIERTARFRVTNPDSVLGATKITLRLLGRRGRALSEEITLLDRQLGQLVHAAAARLVEHKGIGTDTAGALLVAAGDNPERLVNERSYAALLGSSPVDASSGRQRRHRLNRGGDRTANSALYMIVINRLSSDPRTKTYMARRLAEGKTKSEIIRCLKRYVAREVYRTIRTELPDLARAA